jgi:hypothetical protein
VERWRLQGFIAEQQLDIVAPVSQIILAPDGIQVRVHNTTDQFIQNAVVLSGGQGVVLGDIAPGQEVVARWPMPDASRGEPDLYPQLLSALVYGSTSPPAPGSPATMSSVSRARDALVQAALLRNSIAQPTPLLLGWLDTSPLPVVVAAQGAAAQHTALLVATPELTGSGSLTLPPDWLQMHTSGASGSAFCSSEGQNALSLQTAPMTVTLRAPASLAEMHFTDLAFDAGAVPFIARDVFTTTTTGNAVSIELFDWQQAQWVDSAATDLPAASDTAGRLIVPNAAPYVQRGVLVLSLRAQRSGCVPFSAYLRGELP